MERSLKCDRTVEYPYVKDLHFSPNRTRQGGIYIILKRKILAAIISSLLFALILSGFSGFEGHGFYIAYYLNFMFVITYGVIASFFSDWFSKKVANKAIHREIISLLLHCACGAVLQVLGFISAILFFIVDRLLEKIKIGWLSVVIAFSIVVIVFIVLLNR